VRPCLTLPLELLRKLLRSAGENAGVGTDRGEQAAELDAAAAAIPEIPRQRPGLTRPPMSMGNRCIRAALRLHSLGRRSAASASRGLSFVL
jgi:hypothetical protein